MKKLFISALALAAFTACSQEEIVEQQSPAAISFNGVFVENATRAAADPSTTTGSIANFDVWGFMDNATGVIFEDEDVVKEGTTWSYANIQYWSPNHTYYFAALSPMNSDNVTETIASGDDAKLGLGTVGFTNVDGTEDLLYSATTVTTPSSINEQPAPVKFIFNHLLSKVKFTFKNGFSNSNTQLVVRDIQMVAPAKGSINLAQEDWWSTNQWLLSGDETVTLKFGNVANLVCSESDECADERLTIPADNKQSYKVTFFVDLYQGAVLAQTFEETTYVKGVALEIGKAYNFVAELNAANLGLYPITFEVEEVKDWVDAGESFETPTDETVAAGETMTLVSNGVINGSLIVNGTLDGAGHTLTAAEAPTKTGLICPAGDNVKIMNLTIDGLKKGTVDNKPLYGIYITEAGSYTIENVTSIGSTYTLNATLTSDEIVTLNVKNSTFDGWNSLATSATSTFTNVSFEGNPYPNGNAILKPYGDTKLNNCKFVEGYYLDLSSLAEGKTLTINNCYVGETLITGDNITTVFAKVEDYDKKKAQVVINTETLNKVEGTVTLAKNETAVEIVNIAAGATLDGAGHTLELINAGKEHLVSGTLRFISTEGDATIKNLTIDGNNASYDGYGIRGIYLNGEGTVYLDNVIIKNVTYTLNTGVGAKTLTVTNSTLEGWTSYGNSTTATFENVKFECGKYANFKPYTSVTLTDCSFEEGFMIDFTEIGEGETITFKNCTYNGAPLTAEYLNSDKVTTDGTIRAEFK